MGFSRSYLISLFLYISVVSEIRLPTVSCQDEEGSQCLPKKAFLAVLRLPEVSSNLAAYSRTARIIQDAKSRNLKALSSAEENDDAEICIPGGVYLELFRDPAMRGHLSAIGRTQKSSEYPAGRPFDDSVEDESRDFFESEKRSIATLAKNDDLPTSLQQREQDQDDEEKRSFAARYFLNGESLESFLRTLAEEDPRRDLPEILRDYTLPSGEIDVDALTRDYPVGKRNIGSLAREYALPTGRRNLASVARDYGLPSGKRNIGALARDHMLPYGKRNVASLARSYMLPQSGKRNIASLARDYGLPYGKRYLASIARDGGFPSRIYGDDKRSISSIARNADRSGFTKRSAYIPPGGLIMRTLSRHGRSLDDQRNVDKKPFDLQIVTADKNVDQDHRTDGDDETRSLSDLHGDLDQSMRNKSNGRTGDKRYKRQIDFSDEYPLPVMQNANVLDYEEMLEALASRYPEKRFMGTGATSEEGEADDTASIFSEVSQPSKRHIGALARLGWLPSFRPARFSRSPRYLVGRENPADGTPSDYTTNPPTWPLRPYIGGKPRYLQALHGDCRHGFKKFLLLPTADNFLPQKVHTSSRSQ